MTMRARLPWQRSKTAGEQDGAKAPDREDEQSAVSDAHADDLHDGPGQPSELDLPPDPDAVAEERQESATRATGGDSDVGPPIVPPVIVPRWVQLVLLPIGLLGLWALARAAGTVLLILITASIVALILNPVVKMLERGRIPRGLAIFLVYLGGFAIIGGIGVLLADPISTQISRFQKDVPHLVNQANKDLSDFQNWLNRNGIHVHIQQQGQTALQTIQKNILKRSGAIVSFSQDLLKQLVTISFDLVLILVLSIYLLVYGKQIGELVRKIMPAGDGTPEDDFPVLVQHAVFGYVRGQVLFSLIMGASAALALWIFGVAGIFPAGQKYAVFFGAFYGLMEFIPYIGPIIGPAPAVLVALFNDPISAVWVVLLFIALQQLEGHVVAPQVFRISLRINPILIILSLLLGYQIYGVAGALVSLPVAAVIRQTVLYLRRHLVLEPWALTSPGVGVPPAGSVMSTEAASHDRPPALEPDLCPDCGTSAQPGDAFCRTCGASLEPKVRTSG
jgi:predicted PurR-regulated permease PerM